MAKKQGEVRCEILWRIYQDIEQTYSGQNKQTVLNTINELIQYYNCESFKPTQG